MLSLFNYVEDVGHTEFVPYVFISDSVFLNRVHV
jgi:hypothetical protein